MHVSAFSRSFALLLVLSLLTAFSYGQSALTAGSAHYGVYQDGKTVGESDYTVATAPGGFSITSHGKLNLTKFSYSFTSLIWTTGDEFVKFGISATMVLILGINEAAKSSILSKYKYPIAK